MKKESRRAPRLVVDVPAVVESIGQPAMPLPPGLAKVFRRVEADKASIGTKLTAVVHDLSTTGAFITGIALPLLARVSIKFDLRGVGAVDAIGWVLWQRSDDCEMTTDHGKVVLPKGFGVLFEAIPMEARSAIAALVARAGG